MAPPRHPGPGRPQPGCQAAALSNLAAGLLGCVPNSPKSKGLPREDLDTHTSSGTSTLGLTTPAHRRDRPSLALVRTHHFPEGSCACEASPEVPGDPLTWRGGGAPALALALALPAALEAHRDASLRLPLTTAVWHGRCVFGGDTLGAGSQHAPVHGEGLGAGQEALAPGLHGLLLLRLPSPQLALDPRQRAHARQVQSCGETTAGPGRSETLRLLGNTWPPRLRALLQRHPPAPTLLSPPLKSRHHAGFRVTPAPAQPFLR